MRELQQVSADAEAVLKALGSVNALPEDFPEQEIRELCESLRDLKDGTDEGCRSQLESARNRIPKWRRMHFHLEGEKEAESDDVVRLYRDMHLDQRLGRLLYSAGTALDEYRSQVSEHFDDTVVAEETFDAADDAGTTAAMEQAVAIETKIGAAKEDIDDHLDPANTRVDLLKRRLTDGANLARTARSELRARPIVRRWYKGVVDALQKAPALIGAAGRALRLGADVAEPVAGWWAEVQKDALASIVKAIDGLGRALEEIERRLARRRSPRRPLAPFQSFQDTAFTPEMVVLPAGSFLMGSPDGEVGRDDDQGPQRPVTVASFAIGRYPATFAEYDHFCVATGRKRPDDEGWGRGRRPVINVSWYDAGMYAMWLADQTGKTYRLPSEAEWEYACRAGTQMIYWWGENFDPAMANTSESGHGRTTEVGSYPGNPWGLFDFSGNVFEWLEDHRHENYTNAPSDGRAWIDATANDDQSRALRGGSWGFVKSFATCSARSHYKPGGKFNFIGFRVACSLLDVDL
jgi:formylglycine-generating enzyme required for sulfatase activity